MPRSPAVPRCRSARLWSKARRSEYAWPSTRASSSSGHRGPGIADVTLALTDGWTSGKGMGVGLSGSKRLVNEFDIRIAVGEGTCVTIVRWK